MGLRSNTVNDLMSYTAGQTFNHSSVRTGSGSRGVTALVIDNPIKSNVFKVAFDPPPPIDKRPSRTIGREGGISLIHISARLSD